ncbi:MAG: prepilin-type N-terminal cleavage/methylation domain-containing protein [Nitrososphaerota archaeon]
MNRRGFSLLELLVAIVVSSIILLAMASLFIGSNRAFRVNRDVSEMSEDVRNAITTLEFVFSRWGVGVPCANNQCNIGNTIPPCGNQYPPADPMCMDINNNTVSFYANLYGFGFVQNVAGGVANIISCRLNSGQNQNCYYVWRSARLESGFDINGRPIAVRLPNFNGQPDCIANSNPNLSINANLTTSAGGNMVLQTGDYISRAPHMITLRLQGGWLVMDRVDMGTGCTDNENAVLIGMVENFQVQTQGRSVIVNATFVSADGRRYPITRIYGR